MQRINLESAIPHPHFKKPGIDTAKSIALIKAAAAGDMLSLVKLRTDPTVDINFMCITFDKHGGTLNYNYSALSAAIECSQTEAALYLVQEGAEVETTEHYYCWETTKTILELLYHRPLNSRPTLDTDLKLFKAVLRVMNEINPMQYPQRGDTLHKNVILKLKESNDKSKEEKQYREKRLSLYFHEAMLRNEKEVIDAVGACGPEFNLATVQEYIKDLKLNTSQLRKMLTSVAYFAKQKTLSEKFRYDIVQYLESMITWELEIALFPPTLQLELAKPCTRGLKELYEELYSKLFPAQTLPLSTLIPANLRSYLEDQTELFTRLNNYYHPLKENPSFILLAQILYFHKDALQADGRPLFNIEQQKACLALLNDSCCLSASDKRMLAAQSRLFSVIDGLQQVPRSSVEDGAKPITTSPRLFQ